MADSGSREREVLARGDMPRHVAVIMDGNGRWAKKRHRPRIFGHREGMKSVRTVIETAADLEIPYLTLFAFSQENWKRPRAEVDALMALLRRYIESERDELVDQGIKVEAIGELDRLEGSAREAIEHLIEATAEGENLTVTLCLSYGGRTEIVEAAKRAMRKALRGEMDPDELDEESFGALLYTTDLPDPDLLIRTSGELRVSNFLLWQIAYTELYITDILWPDFDRAAFVEAIAAYQRRERRFGTVHA